MPSSKPSESYGPSQVADATATSDHTSMFPRVAMLVVVIGVVVLLVKNKSKFNGAYKKEGGKDVV